MELLYFRIASVIIIAAIYMLFDVFNHRNVPSIFAYATIGYGIVLTLLYLNASIIELSVLVAVAVLGFGYFLYKAGQLGLGDAFELAAISLILPLQRHALFGYIPSLGLPLEISLLINTGISALIVVPLYYIPKYFRSNKKLKFKAGDIIKALTIGAIYLIFIIFLWEVAHVSIYGILVIAAVGCGSVAIILFEKAITSSMVDMVDYRNFEEGDIIAFNIMEQSIINETKKRIPSFDRLVTKKLINEMRSKHFMEKFPVYKRAVP
ncbi:MAG: hypothetical protein QXN59_01440, partial [Candidatus Micrarchaeaceae archaeon]